MDLLVCRSGCGGLVWICWSVDQVVGPGVDLLVCRSGCGGLVWICWSADQVVEAWCGSVGL